MRASLSGVIASGRLLDLDSGVVFQGAKNLIWPGHNLVFLREAIEDFDLRSSGNTRLHRTEQRDAVVQREHTFFFDFLLVLARVGAGGLRRTCSVGLNWSIGVKLANRQGLDGDCHDL